MRETIDLLSVKRWSLQPIGERSQQKNNFVLIVQVSDTEQQIAEANKVVNTVKEDITYPFVLRKLVTKGDGTEQMLVANEETKVIYPVVLVKVDGIICRTLLDTRAGSSYASRLFGQTQETASKEGE